MFGLSWAGWLSFGLAAVLGAWLAFDGTRALVVGDYVTPSSGSHAGQLGPWARLVAAVGLEPRSTFVKSLHVVLGVAWLAAAVCVFGRLPGAARLVLVCAALSLWYVPFGTLVGCGQLALWAWCDVYQAE